MTGRDVQDKLTDTKFFGPKALEFEEAIKANKTLELKTPKLALEFLTLFAVLLMTSEAGYQFDETKLLETYQLVNSKLKTRRQIASSEFLSTPPKDEYYLVLWGKLCFVRS